MTDGGNFWHDFEEHVVIWEDDGSAPSVDAVALPADASHLDAHVEPHADVHDAGDAHLIDAVPADHVVTDHAGDDGHATA